MTNLNSTENRATRHPNPQREDLPDHDSAKPGKSEKERIWEENHREIAKFITQHLGEFGAMPAKSIIAKATGLSRETVYKHLRRYAEKPVDENDMSSFDLMTEQVIAQVLKAALRGDLSAAKLFLETSKDWNNSKAIRRHNRQMKEN